MEKDLISRTTGGRAKTYPHDIHVIIKAHSLPYSSSQDLSLHELKSFKDRGHCW